MDFLNLKTVEERRKARIRCRPRGAYRRRPPFDREQLKDFLFANKDNIKTVRQLTARRRYDEPHIVDYLREFGSWKKARRATFGMLEDLDAPSRPTQNYVIEAIRRAGFNRKTYEARRKACPTMYPSLYWIRRKVFSSWKKARWCSIQMTWEPCIKAWLRLRRKLGGRVPTSAEMDAAGISLDLLLSHQTRAEVNDLLRTMARLDDQHHFPLTP
jgi:hypothetical protein